MQEAQSGSQQEGCEVQAWRADSCQAGIHLVCAEQLDLHLLFCGAYLPVSTQTDTFVGLQITDKKLKGKMRHTERLNSEAAVAAAKTDEWLLPAEAGTLEAEGMERTWRFSQARPSTQTCAGSDCMLASSCIGQDHSILQICLSLVDPSSNTRCHSNDTSTV